MYYIFRIHSSVEGHLGSLQVLAIMNKAAINSVDHMCLFYVGVSFGYMPRTGIAVCSGSAMSNFLRILVCFLDVLFVLYLFFAVFCFVVGFVCSLFFFVF